MQEIIRARQRGLQKCKHIIKITIKYDLELLQIKNKDDDRYKICPECNVILERDEKENRMICINCHHDFCWLCMKPYDIDHYADYNVNGCPGMQYSK